MSLELDAAQEIKHTSSSVAQHAWLMYAALLDAGFDEEHAKKLHSEWWRHLWTQSSMPDFDKIFKSLRGG